MRSKTWFASTVCVVLMVPAFFIGGLCRILYLGMTLYVFGARPDPYHLHVWFDFDTLVVVWKWLNWDLLPNLFQGLVAGTLALYATNFICKGSRTARVGLITGLFYTVVLSVGGLVSLQQAGWTGDLIQSFVQLMGVWFGLVHAMGQLYRE
jgi:hypothetical protein